MSKVELDRDEQKFLFHLSERLRTAHLAIEGLRAGDEGIIPDPIVDAMEDGAEALHYASAGDLDALMEDHGNGQS